MSEYTYTGYKDDPNQGPVEDDPASVNMVSSPTIPIPPPLTDEDVEYGGPFLHIEENKRWQAKHGENTHAPGVHDRF